MCPRDRRDVRAVWPKRAQIIMHAGDWIEFGASVGWCGSSSAIVRMGAPVFGPAGAVIRGHSCLCFSLQGRAARAPSRPWRDLAMDSAHQAPGGALIDFRVTIRCTEKCMPPACPLTAAATYVPGSKQRRCQRLPGGGWCVWNPCTHSACKLYERACHTNGNFALGATSLPSCPLAALGLGSRLPGRRERESLPQNTEFAVPFLSPKREPRRLFSQVSKTRSLFISVGFTKTTPSLGSDGLLTALISTWPST